MNRPVGSALKLSERVGSGQEVFELSRVGRGLGHSDAARPVNN